jgi:hypothetical protein
VIEARVVDQNPDPDPYPDWIRIKLLCRSGSRSKKMKKKNVFLVN